MMLIDDDFVLVESFQIPTFTQPARERESSKPFLEPRPRQRRRRSSAARPSSSQQLVSLIQARELEWLLSSLRTTLRSLKSELENCYALLAPVDPGSTLVLTTPRHEAVKGTITRVGTRITRAAINLRLKTLPPQILTLANTAAGDDPESSIHLQPLVELNTLLSESVDLLSLCVSESGGITSSPHPSTKARVKTPTSAASFLSSQLRQLAQNLNDANAILKGVPDPDQRWTSQSVSLTHFSTPRSQNISFYLAIQDASIVLHLRALEPADAPMNFGAKLAFAIGTARRLEHDEADKVFWYVCDHESRPDGSPSSDASSTSSGGSGRPGTAAGTAPQARNVLARRENRDKVDVYVREKVKVESADPSLLAMSTKLSALAVTLALARRNLAAVMGEDLDE